MDDYNKKIQFALKLLKSIPQDGDVELGYSAGKDSDVILELAKMSGIKFRPIYKLTTLDPPGSYSHAKENGCEIIRPKVTFFQLIRQKGFPSLWTRFCCGKLKEYKICDRLIVGVRRAESQKRAKIYTEPEKCVAYTKTKVVRQYYPILEWTNEDIERFIKERGIKCHPLYYDDNGEFHVERRLGCLGCPLMHDKKRIEEFKKYPKLLKLWIKNGQYFLDTHPDCKAYELHQGSAHNMMFQNLFYKDKTSRYQELLDAGMFPELKIDCKAFLEDYFKIDLTI